MPLPTTRVFHRDWAVRAGADPAYNTLVTITVAVDDGGGGWDPDAPSTPGVPVTVYTGPARITYTRTQGTEGDAAGQDIHSRRVQVTVPRDDVGNPADINGARVHVDAVTDPNAPSQLVERTFYVETASWSSHTWETLLDAVDDQTNQGVT